MNKAEIYNNYTFQTNITTKNRINNDRKEYFKRLDYIRLISCIMIFLYHLKIIQGGFLAVCTFLVLTGYLSCTSALKNKDFSIKSYYINKLKKIYLPLIVVVSSTIIFSKILSINWFYLKPESFSVIFGYNNFWQLQANLDYFTRHINSPFMHLWYISILLQFELIFPIVFVILKKINEITKKNISSIIVFILTIFTTILFYYMSKTQNIMVVYYNTFARSFSIFWGISLALIHHKFDNNLFRGLKKYNKSIFMFYILILILLCFNITAENTNYAIFMIITTIISIRIIKYSTIKKKIAEKPIKIVNFLARSSYEIYLVQYPVIFFIQNIAINNTLKIFLIISLTLIISCALQLFINKKFKNKLMQMSKIIIFSLVILIGFFIIIAQKDHSAEMQELEDKLNENSKIIEEKNQEFVNSKNSEDVEEQNIAITKETNEIDEAAKALQVSNLPIVGIGDSVLLGSIIIC